MQATVAVALHTNHSSTAGTCGAAVCPGSAREDGGGQHRLGLRAWFVHLPVAICSVAPVTVSACDRLSSTMPWPRGKLRHRGTTCPQVVPGGCSDAGPSAGPKAGQTSAWGRCGGSHLSYTACEAAGGGVSPGPPEDQSTGTTKLGTWGWRMMQIGSTCRQPTTPVLEGHPSHRGCSGAGCLLATILLVLVPGSPTAPALSPALPLIVTSASLRPACPAGAGERLRGELAEPAPAPRGRKMEKTPKVSGLAGFTSRLPGPKPCSLPARS